MAPFWPTAQVYGVTKMPELDSTMLYIYFSAMGIPGCGIFTWLMGYLGDHFGLKGAILVVPGLPGSVLRGGLLGVLGSGKAQIIPPDPPGGKGRGTELPRRKPGKTLEKL